MLVSIHHGSSVPISASLDVIRYAQHSLLICTYGIDGEGIAGTCLHQALQKTSANKIKILTNKVMWPDPSYQFKQMKCVQNKDVQIRFYPGVGVAGSHAKFIIADHETCVVGGFNYQDYYFMKHPWSDTCVIIKSSSIANELQSYFKQLWKKSRRESCRNVLETEHRQCDNAKGRSLVLNRVVSDIVPVLQFPDVSWFHSRKSNQWKILIECLKDARTNIDVMSPNVIDQCFWNILKECKKRHPTIQIRIVTNLDHNDNVQSQLFLFQNEHTYFCRQKNIVQIRYANYSYHAYRTRLWNKNSSLHIEHSKFLCIDNKHFYIGSCNMDVLSMHYLGEAGLLFHSQPASLVQEIHTFLFEHVWDKATPIECI